jgi:glycosyltransferase involved in cell wall biosynthesis
MTTTCTDPCAAHNVPNTSEVVLHPEAETSNFEVSLLTAGYDKPYATGISMQLLSKNVRIDFIGGAEIDGPELHADPKLTFLNLRERLKPNAGPAARLLRTLRYYTRLIQYAASAQPQIFHVLWNNKFELFDRTLLLAYYKLLGKKVVFTAHNVNAGIRDNKNSFWNQFGLRVQYRLVDHIFVHTEKMKQELSESFGIPAGKVTLIPFGINNSVPNTSLSPAQAKKQLGLRENHKTILFFGAIRSYKGLEHLVEAFQTIAAKNPDYRLIIAGQPREVEYFDAIRKSIDQHPSRDRILQVITFVPDEDTELYFKAADLVVLPYTHIFQSGVLVLGYSFGLPVIASDVGSMRDDIIEGETGWLCPPCDPAALAKAIERHFASSLYSQLEERRDAICKYANEKYSWDIVGDRTLGVYAKLMHRTR